MELKVRELKAKDLKALVKIMGKLEPRSISGTLASVKANKDNPTEVGLTIFRILAAELADDIYAWLADIACMTPEQMDEQGFEVPIEIVKELFRRGDFKSFFGKTPPASSSPTI